MSASESRLQSYILAQLNQLEGVFFYRSSTGAARTATRLIRFGVPGQADITGVVRGRAVFVEVKTETGRQSELQRAFQERVEAAGGAYLLVKNCDDTVRAVQALLGNRV